MRELWTTLVRTLKNPLGQTILFYLMFLVPSMLMPTGGAVFGMAATTAFSIANPISLIFVSRFWRMTLLSIACWIGLLIGVIATCEALIGHSLQDDTMAFLLPFMVYPVGLVIAGIVRLFRRRPTAVPVRPPSY